MEQGAVEGAAGSEFQDLVNESLDNVQWSRAQASVEPSHFLFCPR
jgi:hypothetical protein